LIHDLIKRKKEHGFRRLLVDSGNMKIALFRGERKGIVSANNLEWTVWDSPVISEVRKNGTNCSQFFKS